MKGITPETKSEGESLVFSLYCGDQRGRGSCTNEPKCRSKNSIEWEGCRASSVITYCFFEKRNLFVLLEGEMGEQEEGETGSTGKT